MRKFTFDHLAGLTGELSFGVNFLGRSFDDFALKFSLFEDGSERGQTDLFSDIVFGAKDNPLPLSQVIIGTEGADNLDATGNDVYAGGGNDLVQYYVQAFNPASIIDGGTGNDHLLIYTSGFRNYGSDTLAGDNDFGGTVDITNNVTSGAYGNLTISNFERLTLEGGGYGDFLRGGSGRDVLDDGGFAITVHGPDSQSWGLGGNDFLYGMDGNDELTGSGGDDIIDGGAGNDVLTSGGGYSSGYYDLNTYNTYYNDSHATLIGGAGNDIINSYGDDTLEGGAGDDTLINHGNSAVAIYSSADASDYVFTRTGTGIFTVEAIGGTGEGVDIINGIDTIRLGGINGTDYDVTELEAPGATIFGTPGDDVLTGTFFNDTIDGMGGDDTLNGGDGNDILIGGAGRDRLLGDAGDDTLFFTSDDIVANGGAGDDVLRYTGADYSGSVRLDGSVGTDTLYLESAYTGSGLANFDLRGSTISRFETIELRAEASGADYDPIWLQMDWDQLAGVTQILAYAAQDIFIYAAPGDVVDLTNLEVVGFNGQIYFESAESLIVDSVNVSWGGTSGDDTMTVLYDPDIDWNFSADGGAGFDVVDFSGMDSYLPAFLGSYGRLMVDLSLGTVELARSAPNGSTGTLTSIEHIQGWKGKNTLIGSAANDTLTGQNYADIFEGRGGDDTLNGGGNSSDVARYSSADASDYNITETAPGEYTLQAIGGTGEGTDTLTGIEWIQLGGVDGTTYDIATLVNVGLEFNGTAGDDVLNGTSTNNTINGFAGDDRLRGYEGNDVLIGGEGNDVAIYESYRVADYNVTEIAPGEYTVESVGGTDEGTDTLTGIETIRIGLNGTNYDIATVAMFNINLTDGDDVYTASDNEVVNGMDGNDTLYADGRDITLYGDGGNDTLFDITSTGRENTLNGGAGADSLRIETYGSMANGDDGDDYIELAVRGYAANGGAGNDIIAVTRSFGLYFNAIVDGGSGNDTLILRYDDSQDMDNDNRFGGTLNMSTGTSTADYRLTTSGFESLDFLGGGETDRVTGTGGGDIINDGGFYSFTGGTSYYGYGNGGDDFLYGMGGDDTLIGTGGTDVLDGGDGNDVITSGADYVSGYDDPIMDIYFAETLDSAAVMLGGAGDDILNSYGNDVLEGGSGDDILINHEDGAVAIYSSANASDYAITEISAGVHTVEAIGGTGEGTDTLTGVETIRLGGLGGTDYDIATLAVNNGYIDLTNGDDVYTGTFGDDFINGLDGDDEIRGETGDDTINGNAGNDTLIGGRGANTLYGGEGDDLLVAGNDSIGGQGTSYLFGGDGNDELAILNSGDYPTSVIIDGGSGTDILGIHSTDYIFSNDYTGGSFNFLTGETTGDYLGIIFSNVEVLDFRGGGDPDTVIGGNGDDIIDGGNVAIVYFDFDTQTDEAYFTADFLYGMGGNDILYGRGGSDTLDGGDGDDVLIGGSDFTIFPRDNDIIIGGDGIDTAVYSSADTTDYIISETTPGEYTVEAIGGTGEGTDTLTSIETIRLGGVSGTNYDIATLAMSGDTNLTNGDDVYTATDDDEIVNGLDGNDTLTADGNNITLNGDAGDDTLISLGNDTLNGGAGNDLIEMGGNVFDAATTTDGGLGLDTLSFSSLGQLSSGNLFLVIDLQGQAYSVRDGGTVLYVDQFSNFENATGSEFKDLLQGDAGNNTLTGLGGDDTLQGRGGDDILNGGLGSDLAVYSSAAVSDYTITEISAGVYTVEAVGGTSEGIDTLTDIEFLRLGGTTYDIAALAGGGTITLTTGDDVYSGPSADVIVNALDGDDVIDGGAGNNTLNGDAGDDTLISLGNDVLNGGAGNDIVEMGRNVFDAATATDGGADIDTISFSTLSQLPSGNLFLVLDLQGQAYSVRDGSTILYVDQFTNFENATGSEFRDLLQGDAGMNLLSGLGGDDNLQGRDGDDIIDGGAGADIFNGGAGTDIASYASALAGVTAIMGNTSLNMGDAVGDSYIDIENITGSSFDDILGGDANANIINGGAGFDIASYAASSAAIVFDGLGLISASGDIISDTLVNIEAIGGTNFDDRLFGGNDASIFYGGEGNDRLFGRNGDDMLYGEGGNDIILGGRDNDTIDGGAGNDQLRGNEGDDTIFGGDGNDAITGGAGADAMDGGAGIDRVEYTYGTNAGVTASLGNSAINTGDAAGDTYVNIENLYGTSFVDTLHGNAGNNRIDGRNGNDALFGGDGNDYIIGGAGDDVLNGEGGNDLLLGQAGADIYQFDAAHGTDRIIVFTQGEDLIEFTEGVFDFSGLTLTQDGAHVNIVSLEGTIIANNSLVADFTVADFIFAPPPAQEPLQEPLDMMEQDLAVFIEIDALI